MKRKLLTLISVVLTTLTLSTAKAQYYNRAPIASGYNADVIANGIGSSLVTTTNDVDGVSYAFISQDFKATATSNPITYGLPVSGVFTSVVTTTPGLSFELGNYSNDNDLRLPAVNSSGTLVFANPIAATNLYVLVVSGSGTSTMSAVINFTDATTETTTGLAVADWYNGTGFALQGIGRINKTNDALEDGGGTNPRLYQIPITVTAANQAKQIASVTFTKTAGTGVTNVFAISLNKYTTCPAPTTLVASAITQTGATISWTAPATAPSGGYELYYSTSNTLPTDATPALVTGISGLSSPISGLTSPNTLYYVWGRSVCGSTPGPWGFSTSFKTLCGPVTSLNENMDSYATGNIAPDCWARLISGTGTATISSTAPVASGNRQLYQISSTVANTTVIVLPEFTNVNAGTNWLKFKTRASAVAGAAIQVGYVTNPADATTFVSLFAFDVTNTTYDLSAPRSFIIPSTVPANARLAVKNTGTKTAGFYWDDVIWEPTPTCLEPYNPLKTAITSSSVSLSWTAPVTPPASYDIYYSTANTAPTAASVPQVTGIAGTSAVVSSLNVNTTYYFWVRSNCGASQSTWVGSVSGYTGACTPAPTSVDGSGITNITFGSGTNIVNNTTTAETGNYGNYTTLVGNIVAGVSSSVSITYKTGYTYGTKIWIDLNKNLVFDDAELLYTGLSTNANPTTLAANITIPASTPLGNYTMRIGGTDTDTGPSTPCYIASYGSFEDYTVNVIADTTLGTANAELTSKQIKVYPNPFHEILNISNIDGATSLTVADVAGRTVKTFVKPTKELNLSNLSKGVYLVTVQYKDGSKKTFKAIKD